MRRILIIGPGGAGKSTLARRIAERSGLPLIHLDALYWRPGWVETPRPEWQARVAELAAGDRWIMDGNFGGTLPQRLTACDTVLLLDPPPLRCAWRVLRRRWRHRGRARPDMHPECPEKLDAEFLWWILSYRRRKLPRVRRLLDAAAAHGVQVIVLRDDAAVEAFMATFERMETVAASP